MIAAVVQSVSSCTPEPCVARTLAESLHLIQIESNPAFILDAET